VTDAPALSPSTATRVLGDVSKFVARVATVIAVIAGAVIFGVVFANVIDRQLVGQSILGVIDISSFAFLWVIWMGVSLAVRRGAVTVFTFGANYGPWWWRAGIRGLAHGALAIYLGYACWRSIARWLTLPSLA